MMVLEPNIHLTDLPEEILDLRMPVEYAQWQEALYRWVMVELKAGKNDIAKDARKAFETTLIKSALELSGGHRRLAAERLGYGRNTLSRKIQGCQ